jgi:hypothetical protein
MDFDDSDEELPSLETLFPTATESDLALRRSSRRKSNPPVKHVAGTTKTTNRQRSPDFSLAWLDKQREQLDKREAARARTQAMMNEDIEDFDDPDEDRMEQDTENALGRESSMKLKAFLSRIGADISMEGGYRLFRHARTERKFDKSWIRGEEWLEGFEGMSLFVFELRLMLDDETRADHIRYGFVRDMVNQGEKLPPEMTIWFLEHSIPGRMSELISVAFEKSQLVALAYSEVVISAMVTNLLKFADNR